MAAIPAYQQPGMAAQVNPVRKDGALTPPFLLGIEALFYIIPAIYGGAF